MLDIRINNTPLDLASDTEVQITATSPIFDPNNLERVFSLPFSVPSTPRNLRARRHAQRLDAANKTAFAYGRLSIETHHIVTGRVTQIAAQQDAEEIIIANTPLEIWKALQKIKINEILETFDLLDGEAPPFWQFGLTAPGDYFITIEGNTASASAATNAEIHDAGESLADQLNVFYPGIADYIPTSSEFGHVLLDGFIVNLHPIGTYGDLTILDWKNVALYHYNAVRDHILSTNATPLDTHCFPMIKWEQLYGTSNNPAFPIDGLAFVNNAADAVFLANEKFTGDDLLWQNTVIPCVRVPYILNKIAETLGNYTWAGSVWDDDDIQKLFVVNNYTLDEIVRDQWDDLAFYKLNAFQTTINLNNHVPDITAADLCTTLCNTFSLYLRATEGQLEFVKKQAPMLAAPMLLDGLLDARYRTEPNTADGWRLAVTKNGKEAYSNPAQLLPVSTGAGEHENLTANTLYFSATLAHPDAEVVKTPYTRQPGACQVFETSATRSTMPLCLLFCHELQQSSNDVEYLFASHDGLNLDGDSVGAYSLAPDGTTGLYEKWHKGVIEYTIADTLIVTGYFHIGQIQKILTWAIGRGRYYHPAGQIVAAFQELQIYARATGLSPTRIKFLY